MQIPTDTLKYQGCFEEPKLAILAHCGGGIPKLYVKFWWPLFLAMKFTFLFLNLAKIHIFIPKSAYGGRGGPTV